MRARLREAGEAEAFAAGATRLVFEAYDEGADSHTIHIKRTSWLPHALAMLPHASRQGDVAENSIWVCNFIGDFRSSRGELVRAREAYETGLEIAEALAQADPSRPQWRQRCRRFNRIADAPPSWRVMPSALDNYQKSLAIAEALAQADPSRPVLQRDVSVSLDRIADVLLAAGDAKGALANYQESLVLREDLTQADPSRPAAAGCRGEVPTGSPMCCCGGRR